MSKQVRFKDVSTGDPLPSLVKYVTPRQLVMWAGAAEEFSEMHYDDEFAKQMGFPGRIIHGNLMAAFLLQMVMEWIGEEGRLKKIKTTNRNFVLVNEEVTCTGTVAKTWEEDNEHFLMLDLQLENQKGEVCISASAEVTLP